MRISKWIHDRRSSLSFVRTISVSFEIAVVPLSRIAGYLPRPRVVGLGDVNSHRSEVQSKRHRLEIMRTTIRSASLLLFAPFLFAACSGGGGGSSDNGSVSGSLDFVPQTTSMIVEAEPNDTVDQPQPIGEVPIGSALILKGTVGVEGDEYDAFSFTAANRATVTVSLRFDAAPEREIQLGVYDPVAMQLVERVHPSRSTFEARGAFDLVVRAARGSGAYRLTLRAETAPAEIERAGWIGDLVAGDHVRLKAKADDSATRWVATSAEAQSLTVRSPAGASVIVRDVSDGASVTLANIDDKGGERTFEVAALARVEFAVMSSSASTTLPSTVLTPVVDVSSTIATPTLVARALAPVARIERERAAWSSQPNAVVYGRRALEAREGEVLVRARNGADLAPEFAARSCAVRDVIPGISTLVATDALVALDPAQRARATLALARSFVASSRVEFAELNLIRHIQGGPITPNDTFFGLQWHYPLMKLPEAWGIFSGVNTARVAVIDTGRRAHPDLDANTIAGYDFILDPTTAADGDARDADETDVGDGEGPTPSSFHGTHVAGTIAAVTNNTTGVAGVCGPANLTRVMHLRVLGKGGGADSDIAQAVLYAARLTNATGLLPAVRADVINMSLGSPGSTATMQSAVTAARNAGVIVFAAAGNNNSGVAFFPAAYANVVSVSAVDINSVKAPYSNFNATVDLCAPGGDTSVDLNHDTYPDGVLSTLVNEPAHNPIYAFYQGTSMASPHAAGVAALMVSQNNTLSPAQIETILKNTAVDLGAAGQDPIYGKGLIDAFQAVAAAGAGGVSGTPVVSVSPSTLTFGTDQTVLSFQVQNIGGGVLDVGTISDNAAWISTVPHPVTGGNTDVDSVSVTVDRTALPDGNYSGTISVPTTNGGSASVLVAMTVAPKVILPNVDIYVLAVNADTFETVQQVIVNPATTSLAYAFAGLPNGSYLLVAGSDEDRSDGICGPNDIYCGIYPTTNQPEAIAVNGGSLAGYNFVVGPTASTGLGAGAATHRTYHVLPR